MNELDPRSSLHGRGVIRPAVVTIVGAVATTEVAIRSAARVAGWRVGMVVTLPPDRASRHSDFRDLSKPAREAGAEVLHAARINDASVLDRIAAAAPDLVLVAGWSQICGPDLLARFHGRVLGYHPAALPRLRGRAAIPWTILAGEPITAGTLFWMDAGVDSGAIFEQRYFHVAADETAQSLYDKHLAALDQLVARALARLGQGDIHGEPQDDRYATYAAKRTPADGRIDWMLPTAAIDRLIRAVGHPYPGAWTELDGDRLTIWSARPMAGGDRHLACPGQIVACAEGQLVIRTVDGLLGVGDWHVEGGGVPKLHHVLGR